MGGLAWAQLAAAGDHFSQHRLEETAMRFADAPMLALMLIVVPALAAFLWWGWRKKQQLIQQFVRSRLLAQLTVGVSKERQLLRRSLLVGAALFLFLALARPQWGYQLEEVRQRGLDILVAIDCSRSMLAEDTNPNRLRRAKLAALDLMRLAKSDRLGLIAFAGTAFLQCPLTLDDEAFRQSVDALDVNIIPEGGTAMAEVLHTAVQAFKDAGDNYRTLVLLSDGEDHEAGVNEAIQDAKQAGMKVFTLGVGTAAGEVLRERDDKGVTHFINDSEGRAVKSCLNETMLREIAVGTGGFYAPLRGANVMEQVYEKGLAALPKSEFSERLMRRYHERFQWPLGAAILLLLLEVFWPDRKSVRPPDAPRESTAAVAAATIGLLASLAWPSLAAASPSRALRDYQSGNYQAAKQEYERLLKTNTNDARLQLNAGIAAYQAKDYQAAQRHLKEATQAPDLKLQEQAYYNLGNTLYRSGENAEPQRRQLWEQALGSYRNAMALNQQDTNAHYNFDFVKKRIEELPPPESQQQDQKQDQQQDHSTNAPPQPQKEQNQSSQDQQAKNDDQQKPSQSQQAQNSSPDQKQEQPDQDKSQASQEKPPEDQSQKAAQAQADEAQNGQTNQTGNAAARSASAMTPEQAARVLDAQKSEEKPLIFAPPEKPQNRNRSFKNW
jgi:Ca-activated chloride channel homolog